MDRCHLQSAPRARLRPVLLWLLLSAAGLAGCGGPKMPSRWLDRPVTIDGEASEWDGALYSLDESRLLVGAFNDGDNLYLCLGTEDRGLERQVLSRGFTLWIDPDGGKKNVFGLHFPLGHRFPGAGRHPGGLPGGERPSASGDSSMAPPPPAEANGGDRDQGRPDWSRGASGGESALAQVPDSTAPVEILHGNDPAQRFTVSDLQGMRMKLALHDEALIYELKIPLVHDAAHPFAVGAAPGHTIGLGFETPKMERPAGFEQRPEGTGGSGGPGGEGGEGGEGGGHGGGGWGRGGGRGGRGGGWGGGGRGGEGGGRRAAPMPTGNLDVWIRLQLAGDTQGAAPAK